MQNLPTGTVTLLFTDIAGSTHLLTQLGDRYAHALAECRQVLRTAFGQWNGYVVDTQGDAFFVVFARATDAVSAAVAAQRALASHAFPHGAVVQVRMGLHTGEPQRTAEGYVGLDVHRAARLMSAGHGGQVLLSQATCSLVEQELPEDTSLRDLGEHRLKDLGRPMRLFQLAIADLPADFPPLHTLESFPNNLPVQPTLFLGREHEVAAIGGLLRREEARLVTLTGPGGTGKTRLALQVAANMSERFASGVFFVNLAPISDPALVVPTVAETLAVRERSGRSLLERLTEELRQREMLVLLDNFEQVVSAAEQVAALLSACPRLKMLVTSREVLHVRAEHEFPVPPLTVPDPDHLPDLATLSHNVAVALFLQQAQAVKPDFHLTDTNARTIAELCTRLDGLPLAIELAAARMKLFSSRALLARLGSRLSVLTSAARDVPTRQQTLRNTIAWSYNLLDVQEQWLFRQLSVFVGGCTMEAIEALCTLLGSESEPVLDTVTSLVDKSLLQHMEQQTGEEPRFVMLETIREYAFECLESHGETEAARRAHATYFLRLAEEAERELGGPQQVRWLEQLEVEHDNLRAV
nr:adenylate/guanylate cyclase domain-containing protein [Ktedonobacteraceae bacterium]